MTHADMHAVARFFYSPSRRVIFNDSKPQTHTDIAKRYHKPQGMLMSLPRYETSCVERFLRYIKIDTQSQIGCEQFPSSRGQLALQKTLVQELRDMGATDIELNTNGYLFATIPSTSEKTDVPCIGLLAHADTTPGITSNDVKPLLHENYQGGVSCCPMTRVSSYAPTTTLTSQSRSATPSSPPPARHCSVQTTKQVSPRFSPPQNTCLRTPRSLMERFVSGSPPIRNWDEAHYISMSITSVPIAPTLSMVSRSASYRRSHSPQIRCR